MRIGAIKPFTNFRANKSQTTNDTQTPLNKQIKEAQYKGFMAGLAFSTIIGGGYTYFNDVKTDNMLNDMQMEVNAYKNPKIEIKDMNNDKHLDIVIGDSDDIMPSVYDIYNNKGYINTDSTELVDKMM